MSRRIVIGVSAVPGVTLAVIALILSPAAALTAITALGGGTLLGRYIRALARRGR